MAILSTRRTPVHRKLGISISIQAPSPVETVATLVGLAEVAAQRRAVLNAEWLRNRAAVTA